MSKLAWERAAGSAARLATVSVIAAVTASTAFAAEPATPAQAYGAKVAASYAQPMAAPAWGQPAFGQMPRAAFGAPAFAPAPYGAPAFGRAPMVQPATAATRAPLPANGMKMPAGAPHAAHGQLQAPQFGQRLPIFANTHANGITYGAPSYTPPEGFDPKMASSSPFPSDWHRNAWGQQQLQGRAPMPNLAGAPVYGQGWGQQPVAPASVSRFAPAEPTYAPAEPLRPSYSAAPAPAAPATYESVDVTPAAAAPAAAPAYKYEMAPASSSPTYVGASTEIGGAYQAAPVATAANPYEVVIGQSGAVQSVDGNATYTATAAYQEAPVYQAAPAYAPAPAYQAAPAYEAAPAYQPAPAYEAAPAYESSAVAPTYETQTGGYEMTTEVPAYTAATTYGTEGYAAAPAYQAAPAYEAAPAYQAALPAQQYGSSSFSSGNQHFVQVGAFRNIARAERLVRKLQASGEQPIITQAEVRGKLFHRVRVPAMDKRDAKMVQSRIRGLGYYEARMVRG